MTASFDLPHNLSHTHTDTHIRWNESEFNVKNNICFACSCVYLRLISFRSVLFSSVLMCVCVCVRFSFFECKRAYINANPHTVLLVSYFCVYSIAHVLCIRHVLQHVDSCSFFRKKAASIFVSFRSVSFLSIWNIFFRFHTKWTFNAVFFPTTKYRTQFIWYCILFEASCMNVERISVWGVRV